MFNGWTDNLLVGIQTLNQILTAGIAITAFSLFLYSLSFNLRDRVARSFAIILLCVVVVFTTEALQNRSVSNWGIDSLLRLQWLGNCFPSCCLPSPIRCIACYGRTSVPRAKAFCSSIHVCHFLAVSCSFWLLVIFSVQSSQMAIRLLTFNGPYGLKSLRLLYFCDGLGGDQF